MDKWYYRRADEYGAGDPNGDDDYAEYYDGRPRGDLQDEPDESIEDVEDDEAGLLDLEDVAGDDEDAYEGSDDDPGNLDFMRGTEGDERLMSNVGAAAWLGRAKAAAQPDDELVALTLEARAGSDAAFSALFERFQTPIVNYLYRLMGDWDAANDLAQDTFLKAYNALPRTDSSLQISPWLYRIATNTALDALRRRKRITWVPFSEDWEPHSPYPDPATTHAESDAIAGALALVPADQRICLVLNMYQGLSYKEIAETLGISVNLVAVRIFRGREKFVDTYKKANPSE